MNFKIRIVQQRDLLKTWTIVWSPEFRQHAMQMDYYYRGNIRGALSGWTSLERCEDWVRDYVGSMLRPRHWGGPAEHSFTLTVVPLADRKAPRKVARVPHIYQKYNRPPEFYEETNDCSVHALTIATGCSYAEAHEVCRVRAQRKPRNGTLVHRLFEKNPVFAGHKFTDAHPAEVCNGRSYRGACSLAKFIKANPTGMFFVSLPRHSIVVWDGHTIDAGSRAYSIRVTVRDAWKVEKCS
jgi:hypothetical protein